MDEGAGVRAKEKALFEELMKSTLTRMSFKVLDFNPKKGELHTFQPMRKRARARSRPARLRTYSADHVVKTILDHN